MSGHGHVKPNPDGSRTRCGGPGICDVCSREAASEWWAMRAERDDAEDFLRRHGYHRCDIPACNCGSWHGGHANARMSELRVAFEQDEHTNTNGKTLLNLVCEVLTERGALRAALDELVAVEDEKDQLLRERLYGRPHAPEYKAKELDHRQRRIEAWRAARALLKEASK